MAKGVAIKIGLETSKDAISRECFAAFLANVGVSAVAPYKISISSDMREQKLNVAWMSLFARTLW